MKRTILLFLLGALSLPGFADDGDNRLVSIEPKAEVSVHGTLVSSVPSAPPGVGYVIVNDRSEATHYVMEAAGVSLRAFSGKSVTVNGTIFAKEERFNTPVLLCRSMTDGISTSGPDHESTAVERRLEQIPASDAIPRPKFVDSLVESEGHGRLTTEVGILRRTDHRVDGAEIKYSLSNNGVVLRYVVEPGDVNLAPFEGRPISMSGYVLGRTSKDNVSVVVMKTASTFG